MAVHRIDCVYKIRNKDGKWSTGGVDPVFNSVGKVWSRLSDVNRHLREVLYYKKTWNRVKDVYRECDLVYFTELRSDTHSMEMFIGIMEDEE